MANILWNLVLYRREEEILAFLVLGKMLCAGHPAAGSHILISDHAGGISVPVLKRFWMAHPRGPIALGNGLAMKEFWSFTVCTQLYVP